MFILKPSFTKRNFKLLLFLILFIYVPTVFILLLVGLISWQTDIPIMDFTRDPLSVMNAPFYIGIVSNIGAIFWSAGAAVCFFSAWLIKVLSDGEIFTSNWKRGQNSCYFLLFGGIVTAILLLDDLFLLHEQVFPQYLHTSERQVFLGYLLMLLVYLVFFRKKIAKTNFMLLGLSLLQFASSIVIDEIFVEHFTGKFLIEDGFKLLGILTWMLYFASVAIAEIKSLVIAKSSS